MTSSNSPSSVLITGANAGLGFEAARQLAALPQVKRVVLGCRNETKAKAAQQTLQEEFPSTKFEILLMDVSKVESCKTAAESLTSPVEALIMNAGGVGGGNPGDVGESGVTNQFAMNLLGHVVLLDKLVELKKLTKVAMYSGSEGARGEIRMMLSRPKIQSGSVEEFTSIANGSIFTPKQKQDHSTTYTYTKLTAALWMGAAARQYPHLRVVTMSPGHTIGTTLMEKDDLPVVAKWAMNYFILPLQYALGMAQSVQVSAKRYVDAVCDSNTYETGVFYASARGLTGPVCDQAVFMEELQNTKYQDNASKAVHSFL